MGFASVHATCMRASAAPTNPPAIPGGKENPVSKFDGMSDDFVRSYGHEPLSDEDLQREAGLSKDPMANDGDFWVGVDSDGHKSNRPE